MKNIIFISTIFTMTIFASFANAQINIINCDGLNGTNNSLTLVVLGQNLKQIRVQTNGSLPRAFIPNRILHQNINGIILYTITGMSGMLEVDNQVLAGEAGIVRLENDEFSCL